MCIRDRVCGEQTDAEIVADVMNKRNDGTSSDEEAVSYTHLDVYKRQIKNYRAIGPQLTA